MSKSFLFVRTLGNDDRTFQIKSIPVRPEPYGYVHHHGIYSDMDLLEFSASLSPADFRFTSAKALQEVSTGKCVARKTAYNRQLILRSCAAEYVDSWYYNATSQLLVDTTVKMCFSPWQNSLPPYDISLLTGLSPCDGWNTVALVYGECVFYSLIIVVYSRFSIHAVSFQIPAREIPTRLK